MARQDGFSTATAPILIVGPTASGKSALALALARRLGGAVVNADAMQVYAEWRVLTARPTEAETAQAPHRLYGHVPVARAYSVGAWLTDLRATLAEVVAAGLRPILVGGAGLYVNAALNGLADIPPTPAPVRAALAEVVAAGLRPILVGGAGLYVNAALNGLADIPPTPAPVRAALARRLAADGLPALAAELARRDPDTAAATDLRNPRRVTRALETLEATGRGLAAWRAEPAAPLLDRDAATLLRLDAPRDWLRARIDARFAAMLEAGALEEARRVMAAGPRTAATAHGGPELMAVHQGRMTLAAATAQAQANTRAYARRQETWFRKHMADWTGLPADRPADGLAAALEAAGP